jgi:hypothetical protein
MEEDKYPYATPFPHPAAKGDRVTSDGLKAPVTPEKCGQPCPCSKLSEKFTVDGAIELCNFVDSCPVPAGADYGEAIPHCEKCEKGQSFGCPVYFKEAKPMKFAELKEVELFSTGVHRGKNFDKGELDEISTNFQKFGKLVKPPMVLGHDENQEILQNSGLPAAGWTVATKVVPKDGEHKLVADFSDVPEVVKDVIGRKAYKRISVELYPNFKEGGSEHGLMLRRVGLLGADVPEVKNLQDVVNMYDDGDSTEVIYASDGGTVTMADEEKKKQEEEAAAKAAADAQKMADDEAAKKKKEEEEAAAAAAAAGDKEKMGDTVSRAEFDELKAKYEASEKRSDEATQSLAEKEVEAAKAKVSAFIESRKKDGKILPAWEEMGLARFMESLSDTEVVKFTEKNEVSPLKFVESLFDSMPNVVRFDELAKDDPVLKSKVSGRPGVKNVALNNAAEDYVAKMAEAGKTIKFSEAVKEVARRNPDLVEQSQ